MTDEAPAAGLGHARAGGFGFRRLTLAGLCVTLPWRRMKARFAQAEAA